MNKKPPLYPTHLRPVDIIGHGNMGMFEEFIKLAENTGEFPERLIKKNFSSVDRKGIAETLSELRANGFYQNGFNSNGSINWATILKSDCQVEFEKELDSLKGLSISELQNIARGGYKNIG